MLLTAGIIIWLSKYIYTLYNIAQQAEEKKYSDFHDMLKMVTKGAFLRPIFKFLKIEASGKRLISVIFVHK